MTEKYPAQDEREDTTPGLSSHLTWDELWRMQESSIFLLGLICVLALLVTILLVLPHDAGKAGVITSVIISHLTAGRAVGISTGMGGGLTRLEAIALGVLIESAVVCLFFSVFCLSFKRLITVRFLKDAMQSVHRSAQAHRGRLLRWGIPGLFFFVWFPFFMTGPVVGSVIGFLLGMRPWVVTLVVLVGTCSAIVSWTFALGPVVEWAQQIGEFVPLMLVFIILVLAASYRFSRFREAQEQRRSRENGNGEANGK